MNNEIIAYIAYRCYSINLLKKSKKENFPAIEVYAFAVSKKYQNLFINDNLTLSHEIFNIMLNQFSEISNNHIKANYIVLHSVERAIHFYEKVGFRKAVNCDVLEDDFHDECVPMIMAISK